jgi:HSP20 family molecular chaperone IbpA
MITIIRQPFSPPHPCFQQQTMRRHYSPCWVDPSSTPKTCSARCPKKTASETQASQQENRSSNDCAVFLCGDDLQVTKTKGGYALALDVPGVQPSNLHVHLRNNEELVVETERSNSARSLSRRFDLDLLTMDTSGIKAELSNGVLTLFIPRQAAPAPVQVPISTEAAFADSEDVAVLYSLDTPGVSVDAITATLSGRILTVHAERQRGSFLAKVQQRILVNVATVDTSAVKGYLNDGVLTIVAPKKIVTFDQHIPVQYNSPQGILTTEVGDGDNTSTVKDEKDGSDQPQHQTVIVETVDAEENDDAPAPPVEVVPSHQRESDWEHVTEN